MINLTNFLDVSNLVSAGNSEIKLNLPGAKENNSSFDGVLNKTMKNNSNTKDYNVKENKDFAKEDYRASKAEIKEDYHVSKDDKKVEDTDNKAKRTDESKSNTKEDDTKPVADAKVDDTDNNTETTESNPTESNPIESSTSDSNEQVDSTVQQKVEEIAEKLGVDDQTLASLLQALNVDISKLNNIQDLEGFVKDLKESLESIIQSIQGVQSTEGNNSISENISIKEKVKVAVKVLNDNNDVDETLIEKIKIKLSEKIKIKQINEPKVEKSIKESANQNLDGSQLLENLKELDKQLTDVKQQNTKDSKAVQEVTNSQNNLNPQEAKPNQVKASENSKEVNKAQMQIEPQTDNQTSNLDSQGQKDSKEQEAKPLFQNIKVVNLQTTKQSESINNIISTVEPMQSGSQGNKIEIVKNTFQLVSNQKSEIFNQIVEQAKLTLKDTQTEMEMTLKPENLGKLAVKVVTENGLVTAHITAENSQVKQIIESNLAQFQESLKQQGLSIQQFSVTVGQDKKQEFLQKQSSGQKQNKVVNLNGNYAGVSQNYIQNQTVRNPYLISESSIDYIA